MGFFCSLKSQWEILLHRVTTEWTRIHLHVQIQILGFRRRIASVCLSTSLASIDFTSFPLHLLIRPCYSGSCEVSGTSNETCMHYKDSQFSKFLEPLQSSNYGYLRNPWTIGIVVIIELSRAKNDQIPPSANDRRGFMHPKFDVFTKLDLFQVRIIELKCRWYRT